MKDTRKRPRIALLAMGIMGEQPLAYGIPVLTDLFKRLSNDYDITFYAFSRQDPALVPKGIALRRIARGPFPGRLKYLALVVQLWLDSIFNSFQVIFSVSVFPTGQWAVRIGKLTNTPVVVQAIALELISIPEIRAGNLYRSWLARITAKVYAQANSVVAVAEYQKTKALEYLPPREVVVLPLRIDPGKFVFHEKSIASPVEFIHIAYYSPIKDQDTMFRCFARLAKTIDCRLNVIGMGYDSPSVNDKLVQLGIRDKVFFTGPLKQSELLPYLEKAHIMLHTARFETGCAVIQEAMASGVAVCGTRVGLLADIGENYAVIAEPGDDEELARKVIDLIRDSEHYRTMTRSAHEWITTYDAAWSAENYRRFLSELISAPKPSPPRK